MFARNVLRKVLNSFLVAFVVFVVVSRVDTLVKYAHGIPSSFPSAVLQVLWTSPPLP